MKVYIIGGDKELVNFLSDIEITEDLKEAKIVIFGDGPIVSPSLYKEKKLPDLELKCDIKRDRSDKAIYTKLRKDQIALGIGRGACFLSVMNGAKLIQFTEKSDRYFSYFVEFLSNGKKFHLPAISNWVQAININNCTDFKLLCTSNNTVKYYISPNEDADEITHFMRVNGDPELVVFKKENRPISICTQYHPEWMPESSLSRVTKDIIYDYANK